MKSAAALLALIGFVSVSQVLGGPITDVSAKAIIGGTFVLKLKTDADIAQNGFITVTASRPVFKKGESQATNLITSSTDPTIHAGDTAGTNAAGTELKLIFAGAAFANHANVKTITFAAGVLDTAALGLAAGTFDIDVTANAGPTAATTDIAAMVISSTATSFAIGPTAMATSQFKGAAPGDYTFTFFPGTTITTGSTLTITADQAIFTGSVASASAPIKVLSQFVPTGAGTLTAVAGTHTCVTDAAGKVLTITLGGALTAEQKTVLTMETVMANNPATASMVTIEIDASAGSTTATSVAYPIFDKANEILFVGAAIDTNKVLKTETTTKITMDIVPQVAVAAGKIITLTASEAIWAAAAATTCGIVEHGGTTSITTYADCTASTTSVLKVTIAANYALAAKTRYTIEATTNIAANKNAAAVVTFKVDSDTTDNVESAATYGYAIFNAATTSAWISGVVTPLSATSTPTSLAVTFVPHTEAVNTDKATITASTAIFTASQTAVTEACTTFTTYPKSVACTAETDTTGKILVVTLSAAGENFLANAKSTITITDKLVANAASGTATTFSFVTTKDTVAITAQTGYTTTAAPVASLSANSTSSAAAAASSNPHTTVTQVYTFPSLTTTTYTGNTKGNMECAYANNVEAQTTPTWCVAATGSRTYKAGIAMSSSVARRAATVTFTLKVDTAVLAKSALETKVATSSTAAKFNAALTAVNTGTGFNITDPGLATTVATATFTSSTSGASSLLPSMLGLVSALFIAFKHM